MKNTLFAYILTPTIIVFFITPRFTEGKYYPVPDVSVYGGVTIFNFPVNMYYDCNEPDGHTGCVTPDNNDYANNPPCNTKTLENMYECDSYAQDQAAQPRCCLLHSEK